MANLKKISISVVAFIVLILVLSGYYYIKLSFSEGIRFSEGSIEYFLLVPSILKNVPIEAIGVVKHYYYSAADGPKPLINVVELESDADQEKIRSVTAKYFLSNQFSQVNPGEFQKDSQQVVISLHENEAGGTIISIELFEII